ncbi:hypothetical protein RQP46_001934 [Phenoliferia psychrophenolica]
MSSQATATAEPRAQLGSFPPVASGSSGASAPQRQRPVLSSLSTDSASLAPTASTFSLASSFANAGFTESPAVHSAHHTFTPHADLPFPSSNANFGIKPKSMGDHSSSTAASARLFRQLEVIKTLQSDIAKQHAKLEGVAGGSGANDWVWAVKGTKGVEVAEEGKAAGDAADAEGKGAAGAAGAKATTAKAYDAMVAEFSDRQAGVSEIMSTVSPFCHPSEKQSIPVLDR